MKRINTVLFVIGILVLLGLACGSDNTGAEIAPAAQEEASEAQGEEVQEPEPTATTAGPETFGVGDVIEVQDHTIVLNSLEVQDNKIIANFTVENMGATDLVVSSLLSFEARDDGGSTLEQDIFDCGPSLLDGTILPADRLTGNICWDGLATDIGRIYYRADLLGSGAIVWSVEK